MVDRRQFLKIGGAAAGAAAASMIGVNDATSAHHELDPDRYGVLTDYTECIGCRRCEWACAEQNKLPHGPIEEYDDQSVFENMRRPAPEAFTVVNRYEPPEGADRPLNVKVQCMHCEHPPCVSACIVGALEKTDKGPVIYDAWKCIGCRYCMVACPFQIPQYEYENPLTPKVMKCTMCQERTLGEDKQPACVEMCPVEALTFGKRKDLLALAHEKIRMNPDRYHPQVYGEHDGGGTSWLMISDRSFTDTHLPELEDSSPAEVTERIQHGIFRGFSGPFMVLGLVSILMISSSDQRKWLGGDHE